MKATLSFDLDDSDDRRAHLRCVKAEDMALLLWHYEHRLWDRISERIDNLPPPDPEEHRNREWQVVSAVMEEMRAMMHDASINTDDLII